MARTKTSNQVVKKRVQEGERKNASRRTRQIVRKTQRERDEEDAQILEEIRQNEAKRREKIELNERVNKTLGSMDSWRQKQRDYRYASEKLYGQANAREDEAKLKTSDGKASIKGSGDKSLDFEYVDVDEDKKSAQRNRNRRQNAKQFEGQRQKQDALEDQLSKRQTGTGGMPDPQIHFGRIVWTVRILNQQGLFSEDGKRRVMIKEHLEEELNKVPEEEIRKAGIEQMKQRGLDPNQKRFTRDDLVASMQYMQAKHAESKKSKTYKKMSRAQRAAAEQDRQYELYAANDDLFELIQKQDEAEAENDIMGDVRQAISEKPEEEMQALEKKRQKDDFESMPAKRMQLESVDEVEKFNEKFETRRENKALNKGRDDSEFIRRRKMPGFDEDVLDDVVKHGEELHNNRAKRNAKKKGGGDSTIEKFRRMFDDDEVKEELNANRFRKDDDGAMKGNVAPRALELDNEEGYAESRKAKEEKEAQQLEESRKRQAERDRIAEENRQKEERELRVFGEGQILKTEPLVVLPEDSEYMKGVKEMANLLITAKKTGEKDRIFNTCELTVLKCKEYLDRWYNPLRSSSVNRRNYVKQIMTEAVQTDFFVRNIDITSEQALEISENYHPGKDVLDNGEEVLLEDLDEIGAKQDDEIEGQKRTQADIFAEAREATSKKPEQKKRQTDDFTGQPAKRMRLEEPEKEKPLENLENIGAALDEEIEGQKRTQADIFAEAREAISAKPEKELREIENKRETDDYDNLSAKRPQLENEVDGKQISPEEAQEAERERRVFGDDQILKSDPLSIEAEDSRYMQGVKEMANLLIAVKRDKDRDRVFNACELTVLKCKEYLDRPYNPLKTRSVNRRNYVTQIMTEAIRMDFYVRNLEITSEQALALSENYHAGKDQVEGAKPIPKNAKQEDNGQERTQADIFAGAREAISNKPEQAKRQKDDFTGQPANRMRLDEQEIALDKLGNVGAGLDEEIDGDRMSREDSQLAEREFRIFGEDQILKDEPLSMEAEDSSYMKGVKEMANLLIAVKRDGDRDRVFNTCELTVLKCKEYLDRWYNPLKTSSVERRNYVKKIMTEAIQTDFYVRNLEITSEQALALSENYHAGKDQVEGAKPLSKIVKQEVEGEKKQDNPQDDAAGRSPMATVFDGLREERLDALTDTDAQAKKLSEYLSKKADEKPEEFRKMLTEFMEGQASKDAGDLADLFIDYMQNTCFIPAYQSAGKGIDWAAVLAALKSDEAGFKTYVADIFEEIIFFLD